MTRAELILLQSLPLEDKIAKSRLRIREWYEHWCGAVYVSYSGGKDSTVLLDLVKEMYPDVPAVYCNTGLEYPETMKHIAQTPGLIYIQPQHTFPEVLKKYGFPIISREQSRYIYDVRNTKSEKLRRLRLEPKTLPSGKKGFFGMLAKKWRYLVDAPFKVSDACCLVMKKRPFKKFDKETGRVAFTGVTAAEGRTRTSAYLRTGCNAYDLANPKSAPLGFWTEQDILRYAQMRGLKLSPVYGRIEEDPVTGELRTTWLQRTGCVFCMFGVHLEHKALGTNRFIMMKQTHPKLWDYCMYTLGCAEVLEWLNVPYGKEAA